ncbi:uncharacterized protein [Coffea arabica]|uniref:Uncharacterized protein isoform X2 n=1 Tax=Coffea arabica TaxID=13443 RepID=A0ABM4WFB2_COFAR|nr:transcriptional corepressor LEUNIG_HOMOLOG-like isoform X2 [Coffea arabica]
MAEWNPQKVLDKYVHDYMIKKNMHEAAEIFVQEDNLGEHAVAIDCPEGFLKEWWSLFWDIYCSRLSQANEVGAAEPSPEDIVPPTGNVLQNIPPIMPRPIMLRPPVSQQTTRNKQQNPLASLPRPQLIQQALNSMQTTFPLLSRLEMIQQPVNAMQTPFPMLPRPEMIHQAMNAMQTPFPILPRAETIQQAMDAIQTSFPILPRPEMIQQAMNVMQATRPILPRPEINQQVMSVIPMSKLDFSSNFAVGRGFDLTANFQLLEVEKMTQMLPSSSNFSRQHQIPEEIQRQKMFENIQAQFARDGGHGLNLETSKDAVPVPQGAPQAAVQEREVFDAGKGKSVQQIPVHDHLLRGVGSFSPGRRQPYLSTVPLPNQQQQTPAFGAHYQQYHLAKPEVQNSGRLTLPVSGSFCNLPSRMIIDFDLGKVLQLPGNAQIGSGTVVQQRVPGLQMAKETLIPEKQQTPELKRHKSKESVKSRKNSSSVLPVPSNLDGSNAEGQNTMDEDIQLHIPDENDNCNDLSTALSTFQQTSPALDKSAWKGFSFGEFGSLQSPNNKLLSCHFTSTGRLLAGAGYEKKILIWNMETLSVDVMEGHSDLITDIRFRPNSTVFATSSFDKSLQIWDASKPTNPPSKLDGHSKHVMSLDFHPRMGDVLCSCDSSNEMRIWNVTRQTCVHTSQGGSRQVRFQPQRGDLLASASGNIINLIDVETNKITYQFKGHDKDVRSLCWDNGGTYIASVSEDSARIWTINLGGRCIYHLHCTGNKYESCTFHPGYAQLMVIGTNQRLELWSPTDTNKTQSYDAHDDIIAALADSPHTETIASASHDNWLKLWK